MPSNIQLHLLSETHQLLKKSLKGYRVTRPNAPLNKSRHHWTSPTETIEARAKHWIRIHKQCTWIKKELGKSAITGKPINLQYTGTLDIAIILHENNLWVWWLNYPPAHNTIPEIFTIPIDIPDAFDRIINYIKSHVPK
jgi:hypothetical protein